MDTKSKDIILILVTIATCIETGGSKTQDVCNWTTYKPTCGRNEVIQMEQAHYGHMSVGNCIKQDVRGFTRCQINVLAYLDSVCSGRQTCQVKLPDKQLPTRDETCFLTLEAYLQLQYNCISVYTSHKPCTNNLLPVSGTNGLLANFITGQTGQGSARCPWEVKGAPGQKIRLTLHDYGVWKPRNSESRGSEGPEAGLLLPKRTGTCQIYAVITEGYFTDVTQRTITICGGEMRENVVYVSGRESIQIALTDPNHSQSPAYFLLKYEVIGCPAYTPPEGAVIEPKGDELLVRCPHTGNDWRVSCDGMRWTSGGEVKNCNESVVPSMSFGNLVDSAQDLPQWILIVVIIVAAAIIAVPILVIGIVSFRRKHDVAMAPRTNPQMESSKCMSPYYAKELNPMLVTDERSQKYPPGREYTSTAHRQMAVRPDAVTPGGRFPPLPLPPAESIPDAGNNTVQGTLTRRHYQRDGDRTIFKPPMTEHKYGSPKFLERTRNESVTPDAACLGVAPEGVQLNTSPPIGHTESDSETD